MYEYIYIYIYTYAYTVCFFDLSKTYKLTVSHVPVADIVHVRVLPSFQQLAFQHITTHQWLFSCTYTVICFVLSGILKCRLLKWLLDHPMNVCGCSCGWKPAFDSDLQMWPRPFWHTPQSLTLLAIVTFTGRWHCAGLCVILPVEVRCQISCFRCLARNTRCNPM